MAKNTRVFGPQKKITDKQEVFERRIAELEQELQDSRASVEVLRKSKTAELARAEVEREQFLGGLSLFLNELYSSLGKTQNHILRQAAKINEHIVTQNERKNTVMTQNLTEVLAIAHTIGREDKDKDRYDQ